VESQVALNAQSLCFGARHKPENNKNKAKKPSFLPTYKTQSITYCRTAATYKSIAATGLFI
jgi:hypothetical protein